MTALFSIGDFSRATHLSVKALRRYHEMGLLEPFTVDRFTGYRSYAAEQVPVAQVIRRFRDLGMPLEQLKAVLSAPDLEARNREIVAHLDRMQRELAATRATVDSLRALLEAPAAPAPVTFRSIPATAALGVCEVVQVETFPPWWTAAFGELDAALRAAGVTRTGPPGALYSGDLFEQEEGELTAFVPDGGGAPPSGRFERLLVPEVEVAVMVHEGSLDDLDVTYGALGTLVAERAIGVDGPIREYYLVSPFDTTDTAALRTEVCWPVFRTAESPSPDAQSLP